MGLMVELDLTKITSTRSLGDHHVPSPECSLCIMVPIDVRTVGAFEQHIREQEWGAALPSKQLEFLREGCQLIPRSQPATALLGVRVVVELSEKLRTQCGCLSPDPVQPSVSRNTAGGNLGGQSADPSAAESAAHQLPSGLTRPERLDALDDLTNAEKSELLRAGEAPADVQEDGRLLPAAQQRDPLHNRQYTAERRSNIVPQSAAYALSGTAPPGKHVFQETQRCSSCAVRKFPVSFHSTMWDREVHQDRFCRKCLERFWCRGCKKLKRPKCFSKRQRFNWRHGAAIEVDEEGDKAVVRHDSMRRCRGCIDAAEKSACTSGSRDVAITKPKPKPKPVPTNRYAALQPVAEEPAVKDPAAEDPTAEEPAAEDPAAEDPTAEDPAAEDQEDHYFGNFGFTESDLSLRPSQADLDLESFEKGEAAVAAKERMLRAARGLGAGVKALIAQHDPWGVKFTAVGSNDKGQ